MLNLRSRIFSRNHPDSRLYQILGITGIALVLRLYRLGTQSLWYDETYTVFVARLPFNEGWKYLVADGVHHPLFYWIEKIALIFGESEFVVRLPALIFGVLAVPALYLVAKNWISAGQALFASALLALSPYHIWYSQDARMYSALLLLAIVITGLFHSIIHRPDWAKRIAFILLSALAYLIHYFALLLPLIQFVYLAVNIRRQPRALREWTAMQTVAVLPISGWILVLSRRDGQYFGIGWIPESQLKDLLSTVINFTTGLHAPVTAIYWVTMIAVLVFTLRASMVRWPSPTAKLLIYLWAFLPPLLILLLSFRRPFYVDRFLIFCIPAMLILISQGMSALDKKLSIASSLLMIALFVFGWYSLFLSANRPMKENWREAFAYLDENAKADEVIVLRVLQIAVPMRYYFHGEQPVEALEVNRQINELDSLAGGYPGVWLVYWNASADTHHVASPTVFDPLDENDITTAAWIRGDGPRLLDRVDYSGVTLFHFNGLPLGAESLPSPNQTGSGWVSSRPVSYQIGISNHAR